MNKTFSFLLFAIVTLTSSLFGQSEDGAFRLVNATGLGGKLKFYINGYDVNTEGYETGQTTGNLSIAAGDLKIRVEHPMCESGEMELKLTGAQQIAVIAYVEPLKDKQTGKVKKRVIKFGQLESKPRSASRSAAMLFLSISKQVEVTMNGAPMILTPHKQVDVAFRDSKSTGVSIRVGKYQVGGLDLEDPGDYAVIIYDNSDGTQGCVTFYNTK